MVGRAEVLVVVVVDVSAGSVEVSTGSLEVSAG
jgi:hypothetical protein